MCRQHRRSQMAITADWHSPRCSRPQVLLSSAFKMRSESAFFRSSRFGGRPTSADLNPQTPPSITADRRRRGTSLSKRTETATKTPPQAAERCINPARSPPSVLRIRNSRHSHANGPRSDVTPCRTVSGGRRPCSEPDTLKREGIPPLPREIWFCGPCSQNLVGGTPIALDTMKDPLRP